MDLLLQFAGGALVVFGTYRQALDRRGAFKRIDDAIEASHALAAEEWDHRLGAVPWWNFIQKWRLKREKDAWREGLLDDSERKQKAQYIREMNSWILITWGTLLATAAAVWAMAW